MSDISTLYWFERVRWEERDQFIDCLVDSSQQDVNEGHWLVEKEGTLSILSNYEVQNLNAYRLLGRVLKRDCSIG
ncbi:MAG: hypothetical protein U1E78_11565 [Gammaproteobacteria bacterium]